MLILEGHEGAVVPVCFSPDGRWIASGADDKTIRIWDAETGELVGKPLVGHERFLMTLAFSPDGRLLASGSGDESVRVWECATGRPLHLFWRDRRLEVGDEFSYSERYVHAIVFSPDGRHLACGGRQEKIRVWDVETGERLASFSANCGPVLSLLFMPDGSRLVAAGGDGTIRLWTAPYDEELLILHAHKQWIFSIAMDREGKRIASASHDGTVKIWDSRLRRQRLQLREDARRRRAEIQPLVARLFEELGDASRVAARLRARTDLEEPSRQEALKEVLRRVMSARATQPGADS